MLKTFLSLQLQQFSLSFLPLQVLLKEKHTMGYFHIHLLKSYARLRDNLLEDLVVHVFDGERG